MNIDQRVEELWNLLVEEFDEGGPGAVIRRVAETEHRECEAIISYLEKHDRLRLMNTVASLRRGDHRR